MSTRERLAVWLPWPFLGVVALLLVLILLTPNLLSNGAPSAGTFPTVAELVVDRGPASPNVTHLYVKSVGNVRYSVVSVAVNSTLTWRNATSDRVNWGNATVSNDTLVTAWTTDANPVAVNVSATYVDPSGGMVVYLGAYAFDFVGDTLYSWPLLAGESAVAPTPSAGLPLYLLLSAAPNSGV